MAEAQNKPDQQVVNEDAWQKRLLPFMQFCILLLGLFFFAASLYQLYDLNEKIAAAPKLEADQALLYKNDHASLLEKQWASLVVLETHILQQRYHQANVMLLARIWVRYLGFVTGMVLTVIGAVFILGKLREPETNLALDLKASDAQPVGLSSKLSSQSPGIILVSLGTLLMLVTILVHQKIEVKDAPVYTVIDVQGAMGPPKAPPSKTPPPTLQLSQQANQQNAQPLDQSDELMNQLINAREKDKRGAE